MALIPLEHPHRLASPAEAEALFRALGLLGQRVVSCRGFHTTDPARITRILEAIEPKREHTVSFESGTLTPAAWRALEALLSSNFGYLDVQAAEAQLRVWPGRQYWAYAAGSTDKRVELPGMAEAFNRFGDLAPERVVRGFISGITPPCHAPFHELLVAMRVQVHAVLGLSVAKARELTELYAGEKLDWQADGLLMDFPEGRIHGFLKTPDTGPELRAKWLARVEKALRRARIIT
jgi:hypothetical protein